MYFKSTLLIVFKLNNSKHQILYITIIVVCKNDKHLNIKSIEKQDVIKIRASIKSPKRSEVIIGDSRMIHMGQTYYIII